MNITVHVMVDSGLLEREAYWIKNTLESQQLQKLITVDN
jgi:hypothetical protein